uniref:Ras-associating domain-containing protein n=1 Tax=Panagrolaimus sp. ES5 TaxID=591445 RepID=A0AC34GWM4_9BILA
MGLKVISGGIELNVSGVNENTTCLEVVYALAHATNQKGKFILVAHSNGSEHRLSHKEKPLEIVNQCSKENIPVTFELRQLNQQSQSLSNMSMTSCNVSSTFSTSLQSYSHGHLPEPSFLHTNMPTISQPTYSSLKASGKTSSLPPSAFKTSKNLDLHTKPRPPPPTYTQVIGERCNSLSRDMSKSMIAALTANRRLSTSSSLTQIEIPNSLNDDFIRFSRQDLEKIIQQQNQFILHQKSQLLNMDVTLSNASEREIIQLKKQHNNLLTVLNSLRNANWPLRLTQEEQEAERLQLAIEDMRTFVDRRKNELMGLLQMQHSLENQIENVTGYSDAETISQQDDSQYCSINDYAIS